MIVTIDGPAGAGKSTAARALAKRLGFDYLDTGAMYRAVTLAALRAGIKPGDEAGLKQLLLHFELQMPGGRVMVNGEDVTEQIRAVRITEASAAIADSPAVRARLAWLQRQIASGRDMVCEGRDQGTIVFPEAVCKFFLVADPQERARRRQKDLDRRGEKVPWPELLAAQEARDLRDKNRGLAPMVPAIDAIHLDSTGLSLDEVIDRMEAEFRYRVRS
jgi:cytidylate kinase